jgi:diacylglycerol kinase (ATP)
LPTAPTPPTARSIPSGSASELLVLVNGSASHSADGERLLAEVRGQIARAGRRSGGRVTASETELLEEVDGARGRRVVLVGGDGTLHSAVNLGIDLPELALVPAGRANNVARALGIPRDVGKAAWIAATATARPVDLLRVESEGGELYCVEALSAGVQADARSRYNGANSGDLRTGAEAFAEALRRYHPYRVDLRVDGRPAFLGDAAQVFLSNLPFFGYGFRVDPVARPADGLLEAIVLEAGSRLRVARLLVSAYRGSHLGRVGVTLRRATRAVLKSPLPLAGDATPLGAGEASVTVEQGRLRIAS